MSKTIVSFNEQGNKDGPYQIFNIKTNKLVTEGTYDNGVFHGVRAMYTEDEKVWFIENWVKGVKQGKYYIFINDCLDEYGIYKDGIILKRLKCEEKIPFDSKVMNSEIAVYLRYSEDGYVDEDCCEIKNVVETKKLTELPIRQEKLVYWVGQNLPSLSETCDNYDCNGTCAFKIPMCPCNTFFYCCCTRYEYFPCCNSICDFWRNGKCLVPQIFEKNGTLNQDYSCFQAWYQGYNICHDLCCLGIDVGMDVDVSCYVCCWLTCPLFCCVHTYFYNKYIDYSYPPDEIMV